MLHLLHLATFRNAYMIRGLIVWFALRLVVFTGQIPRVSLFLEILLLVVVSAAVGLDAQRRGEDLFLGNLGIPRVAIWLAALPLAVIAEGLLP